MSSIESAPASIPPSTEATLAAPFAPHGPGTVKVAATSCARPTRSSKLHDTCVKLCDAFICQMPSRPDDSSLR